MIRVESKRDQVNIAKVYEAKQDHIFRFWDQLNENERRELLDQVAQLDFQLIDRLARQHINVDPDDEPTFQAIGPVKGQELPSCREDEIQRKEAREVGTALLEEGRVAAVLVAGGQGTRLGFDGPKGCLPMAPVSGDSLFQVLVEKVAGRGRCFRKTIPLYVMTSPETDEATQAFFREHKHFGMSPADVDFFCQDMVPALDMRGRLILAKPHIIFTNPNGHGGVVSALQRCGALKDMERRGVDRVFYFQVDNPLVDVSDPAMLGYTELSGAEMSGKYVEKAEPDEKVGVFCEVNGSVGVVEYMDMPDEQRIERDADGRLRFRTGNIAVHVFRRSFLESFGEEGGELPFHASPKVITYVNHDGEIVTPDEPNGYKFETFVFDAMARAETCCIIETARSEEFAPVKNADGSDSPDSSRKLWSRAHADWLADVGIEVPRDKAGNPVHGVEIAPGFAIDREAFRQRFEKEGLPSIDVDADIVLSG
ncbi:UDPGP type 1 family protein [bacterium AH-315-F18]|nr:UDPGP type 1 family protein [bacterium AH-315-F18]